jgi:hypothetical protein
MTAGDVADDVHLMHSAPRAFCVLYRMGLGEPIAAAALIVGYVLGRPWW